MAVAIGTALSALSLRSLSAYVAKLLWRRRLALEEDAAAIAIALTSLKLS